LRLWHSHQVIGLCPIFLGFASELLASLELVKICQIGKIVASAISIIESLQAPTDVTKKNDYFSFHWYIEGGSNAVTGD
jgi:hypothetical protein